MVTLVGNESEFKDLVENLIYLEHDAIAAYQSCVERLDNRLFSEQISAFKADHLEHLDTLKTVSAEIGLVPPPRAT